MHRYAVGYRLLLLLVLLFVDNFVCYACLLFSFYSLRLLTDREESFEEQVF